MPRKAGRYKGVYEHPPGSGRFMIDYKDELGRRRREVIGPSIEEARAVLEKRRTQVRDQTYFPRRRKIVLAEAIRGYLAGDGADKRSAVSDRHYARLWIAELGDAFLDAITPSRLEHIRNRWRRDFAKNTVNHRLSFLRRIFSLAVRDGHVDRNPVSQVRFYKDETVGLMRPLFEPEEKALEEVFPARSWHLVTFAILTGLRQSEQFRLRWEHVNFQAGVITIPRSKFGEARHVPMHPDVVRILQGLPSRGVSEWVFTGRRGRRQSGTNFYRRVYQPALVRAGLIPPLDTDRPRDRGPGRPRQPITWHTLRHTTASRLVMAGVDLPTVKDIMGHRSIQTTMRYTHLAPSHVKSAIARIAAVTRNCHTDDTPSPGPAPGAAPPG